MLGALKEEGERIEGYLLGKGGNVRGPQGRRGRIGGSLLGKGGNVRGPQGGMGED
jgi:hypothetical protein